MDGIRRWYSPMIGAGGSTSGSSHKGGGFLGTRRPSRIRPGCRLVHGISVSPGIHHHHPSRWWISCGWVGHERIACDR